MTFTIMADSDTHVGCTRFRSITDGQNAMAVRSRENWRTMVDMVVQKSPDVFLLAGDIFDSPNPAVEDIMCVMEGLDEIRAGGTRVFAIAGNHDFRVAMRVRGVSSLSLLRGHLDGVWEHSVGSVELTPGVVLHALPYGLTDEASLKQLHGNVVQHQGDLQLLMHHGVVNNPHYSEEENLPLPVALQFDMVLSGHEHIPFHDQLGKGTDHITLGGNTVQMKASHKKPCLWTVELNENDGHWEISDVRSETVTGVPQSFHITTSNINDVLPTLTSDVWVITMDQQSISEVDPMLWKQARNTALFLSLHPARDDSTAIHGRVDPFWEWVDQNHTEWMTDFKNRLKEQNDGR